MIVAECLEEKKDIYPYVRITFSRRDFYKFKMSVVRMTSNELGGLAGSIWDEIKDIEE